MIGEDTGAVEEAHITVLTEKGKRDLMSIIFLKLVESGRQSNWCLKDAHLLSHAPDKRTLQI